MKGVAPTCDQQPTCARDVVLTQVLTVDGVSMMQALCRVGSSPSASAAPYGDLAIVQRNRGVSMAPVSTPPASAISSLTAPHLASRSEAAAPTSAAVNNAASRPTPTTGPPAPSAICAPPSEAPAISTEGPRPSLRTSRATDGGASIAGAHARGGARSSSDAPDLRRFSDSKEDCLYGPLLTPAGSQPDDVPIIAGIAAAISSPISAPASARPGNAVGSASVAQPPIATSAGTARAGAHGQTPEGTVPRNDNIGRVISAAALDTNLHEGHF